MRIGLQKEWQMNTAVIFRFTGEYPVMPQNISRKRVFRNYKYLSVDPVNIYRVVLHLTRWSSALVGNRSCPTDRTTIVPFSQSFEHYDPEAELRARHEETARIQMEVYTVRLS
jgi:hypothetical protein